MGRRGVKELVADNIQEEKKGDREEGVGGAGIAEEEREEGRERRRARRKNKGWGSGVRGLRPRRNFSKCVFTAFPGVLRAFR